MATSPHTAGVAPVTHNVSNDLNGSEEVQAAEIPDEKQAVGTSEEKRPVADAHDGEERRTIQKTYSGASSSKSKSSGPAEGDLEKGPPVHAAQVDETPDPADPNVVDWEGPDDPQNPYNWSTKKKAANVAILSFMTLLTPLASSMFAPGVPRVVQEFKVHSQALETFVVSVYILGFAFGPLVLAPLSEMYGRVIVYNVCNILYTVFTVACALSQNIGQLIGFRFLAGAFGVSPITLGGGTIADMMKPERRGAAMSIWAIGPLLGPVIGPVAGGFLSAAEGWRWIFWVLAIAVGLVSIVCLIVSRETYAPVLLERKAARLRKETGNPNLKSKLDLGISPKDLWKRSFIRPAKLMFLSPICALMSLYMAIVYGILYLLFTTFTFVFEGDYGFSESIVGLVYIALGVGMIIGLAILGTQSDPIMKRLAAKHSEGKLKPEYRLPLLMYSGPFIPAGLFLYGWTAEYKVQWAVPLLGTLIIGVGLLAAFMCVNTYLIDAYTRYAASAMAANTVLRSILGAVFPLFGLQMYAALGLGWGNSLIGFISLALCPIPFMFYWYGERIRLHPKLQVSL